MVTLRAGGPGGTDTTCLLVPTLATSWWAPLAVGPMTPSSCFTGREYRREALGGKNWGFQAGRDTHTSTWWGRWLEPEEKSLRLTCPHFHPHAGGFPGASELHTGGWPWRQMYLYFYSTREKWQMRRSWRETQQPCCGNTPRPGSHRALGPGQSCLPKQDGGFPSF